MSSSMNKIIQRSLKFIPKTALDLQDVSTVIQPLNLDLGNEGDKRNSTSIAINEISMSFILNYRTPPNSTDPTDEANVVFDLFQFPVFTPGPNGGASPPPAPAAIYMLGPANPTNNSVRQLSCVGSITKDATSFLTSNYNVTLKTTPATGQVITTLNLSCNPALQVTYPQQSNNGASPISNNLLLYCYDNNSFSRTSSYTPPCEVTVEYSITFSDD